MAKKTYLKPEAFKSAQRAQRELILAGTPYRSVKGMFEHDLDEDITRVSKVDARYGNMPAKPYNALVGTQRLKDQTGDPVALLKRTELGKTTVLTNDTVSDIDWRAKLQWIYRMLRTEAPVDTGNYRNSIQYYVGGKVYPNNIPLNLDFTIGGVVATAPYAVTLFHNYGVFLSVYDIVKADAKRERYSMRLRFVKGVGQESSGKYYPSPVLEIGPLNSMARPFRKTRRRRGAKGRWVRAT